MDINEMIDRVKAYAAHGMPVNDIEKIANMALKESYKCDNPFHGIFMYLMAIDILKGVDDGK